MKEIGFFATLLMMPQVSYPKCEEQATLFSSAETETYNQSSDRVEKRRIRKDIGFFVVLALGSGCRPVYQGNHVACAMSLPLDSRLWLQAAHSGESCRPAQCFKQNFHSWQPCPQNVMLALVTFSHPSCQQLIRSPSSVFCPEMFSGWG